METNHHLSNRILQRAGPLLVGEMSTSENIVEVLRVPLCVKSAGDLGHACGIEDTLTLVFDMVSNGKQKRCGQGHIMVASCLEKAM